MPDNTDYEGILDALRDDASTVPAGIEGDTIFENAVSQGVQAEQETDARRWFVGGLADLLKGRYGEDRIGMFAAAIKGKKRRVYEYAQMYGFYPEDARRALIEACPNLMFSHFRTAMTLGLWLAKHESLDAYHEAISFLDLCAASDWGADEAEMEAKKRKGGVITTTVLDDDVELVDVHDEVDIPPMLVFSLPRGTDMSLFADRIGRTFGLKLTEETNSSESPDSCPSCHQHPIAAGRDTCVDCSH